MTADGELTMRVELRGRRRRYYVNGHRVVPIVPFVLRDACRGLLDRLAGGGWVWR